MTKIEELLVRLAYVAKTLIGLAGMASTALLGLSDLPPAWKFPLLVVATVASAVALFKVPNGPSVEDAQRQRAFDAWLERGPYPQPDDVE